MRAEDVLEGVVPRLAGVILDDVVTAVRLVDVDLALHDRHNQQLISVTAVPPPSTITSPRAACNGASAAMSTTHLLSHVVPVLAGVDPRLERGRPRGRVDGGAAVVRARERLPVDEQCDRVLRLGHAVERLAGGDSRRGARDDTRGDRPVPHHPAVDVDVVRRQVVAGRCQVR